MNPVRMAVRDLDIRPIPEIAGSIEFNLVFNGF
jgi:hypothetical protein